MNLSVYFEGVGTKVLTAVDAEKLSHEKGSNQHEVGDSNGGKLFRKILGDEPRTKKIGNPFETRYVWLKDGQESEKVDGFATWYDPRARNPKRAAEWRLYYERNSVTEQMSEGDRLFFAKERNGRLLFLVIPHDSELQAQMLWLWGMEAEIEQSASIQDFSSNDPEINFLSRYMLDLLGVVVEDANAALLDSIIDPFGFEFPSTRIFSRLARKTLPEIDAREDADRALIEWLNREEAMFRRLENRIVSQRLALGWVDENRVADVDGFIKYSMGVQNRRKSRMGHAFENHLAAVFDAHNLTYQAQQITENGKKPDFLFPSIKAYRDPEFDVTLLTMLAAKSTCKDRWSQILPEAQRLEKKHLVTLDLALSEPQTDSMKAANVQLIVPTSLQSSYSVKQRAQIWELGEFVGELLCKQDCMCQRSFL